jgi:hypothetical protein
MAGKAKSNTIRISNPVTGTYYRLRVHSTSAGNKGTIMGKWSPPKKTAQKSSK